MTSAGILGWLIAVGIIVFWIGYRTGRAVEREGWR